MPNISRKFDSPHLRSIREKKIKKRRKIFLSILMLIGALIVFFVILSNFRFLRFDDVFVSGTKVLVKEEIEEFVHDSLKGRFFVIFPRDSVVFYRKKEIQSSLMDKFFRIEKAKFYRNGQTLLIKIEEYTGSYLWCGNEYGESNECYFLDSVGHIFDKSPYFSGPAYLRFYGPKDFEKDSVLGTELVEEVLFQRYLGIVDRLEYLGFEVSKFVILKEGQVDVWLNTSNRESHIYLLADDRAYERINDLALALEQDPLKNERDNGFINLEYLDIRFDDKVYYKLTPTF